MPRMTDKDSKRTRTIIWEDPRPLAEAGRALSGLEFLQKIVNGELPPPPLAALLNFDIVELREGYAVFAVEPAEYHYNPIGVVHGGLAATLLDQRWVAPSIQRYRQEPVTPHSRSK